MIRSLLFAPANRRELLLKFPRVPADCYVIDLEDGTPPRDKAAARAALPSVVAELRGHSLHGLLYVRLNEVSSPHYA
ncbi:MAG: aldolase/citrate lyase family protein, partial [Betaproteobacteria bacterium]